jgi:NAD(P)-dependent dehydrogenase (short-subunit alcohol dehydrogenase family)
MRAYGLSKLCIVYFTRELARRLEGPDLTVNACDPGPVASNIGQNNPGAARRILKVVMRLAFPSAEKAARTALFLASSQEVEGVSGRYYKGCKERRPRISADPAVGRKLWEISEGMLEP